MMNDTPQPRLSYRPMLSARTAMLRFARLAGAAFLAMLATIHSLIAAPFVTIESIGPSTLLARADGAWVLYAPPLSVDCSPPRGCFATIQRIHYDFSCYGRYAVMTERISMDLNGMIVKHEKLESVGGFTRSNDPGAIAVLDTYCPLPDRDR